MNFIEDFAETIKNIQGFQPDLFAEQRKQN